MSHPNAADQAIVAVFGPAPQNPSDLLRASVYGALQLMSIASLVSASATPVADCLDYVNANLSPSALTLAMNQGMASKRERN